MKKLIFLLSFTAFLTVGFQAQAVSVGESRNFYIQPDYDLSGRSETPAVLVKFTSELYFYVDQDFWYGLEYYQQNETRKALAVLGEEFKNNIYPVLTDTFGSEWKPGIDDDDRITILFHPMQKNFGGYFNAGDEYPQIQVSNSNQREMVYLNSDYLTDEKAKSFLAAEFVHLITFNQKDRKQNVLEDVWLNEARAEYSSALLGYDNLDLGSIMRKRLEVFAENPNDSLTEWRYKETDYAVANVFIHYLVDHYGVKILTDSLLSDKTGIESLNFTLAKNGFKENFSQIFTDWSIAVLVNDCGLGEKYCYKNENLKNFRITPFLNFLPLDGKSSLVLNQAAKNWAANWFKFVGGKGDLELRFVGSPDNIYNIPYLVKDFSGHWQVDFLSPDENFKAEVLIPDFGIETISVVLIPILGTKRADFSDEETAIPFFLEASTIKEPAISISFEKPISEMSKEKVLEKISELEKLLFSLKSRLAELVLPEEAACLEFKKDLYYGLTNDIEVECLQKFLKGLGSEIYPEGLVTGNFLGLTKAAVVRFQEKYAEEILHPLGLKEGTGFAGVSTRTKINQLLKK